MPSPLGYALSDLSFGSARFRGLPYRGIERHYFSPDLDEFIAATSGQGPPLDPVWDRFWDAKDSGEIYWDRALAVGLRDEFRHVGLDLEVIYVEVAAIPDPAALSPAIRERWLARWNGMEEVLAKHRARIQTRPVGIKPLGFDLASPFSVFGSVIMNPGPPIPRLTPDVLNANGLLDNRDEAVSLMDEVYRDGYDGSGFVVLEVWAVPD